MLYVVSFRGKYRRAVTDSRTSGQLKRRFKCCDVIFTREEEVEVAPLSCGENPGGVADKHPPGDDGDNGDHCDDGDDGDNGDHCDHGDDRDDRDDLGDRYDLNDRYDLGDRDDDGDGCDVIALITYR